MGPEKYPFYLHKGRLCQHSEYFEKAFHGSFEEATTGSMYLENDGVEEFTVFEEWLYTQKLNYSEICDEPSLLLVKVYCFAEKVGIANLQNASLDAIRDRATGHRSSVRISDLTPKIDPKVFGGFGVPVTDFTKSDYQFKTPNKLPFSQAPKALKKYFSPATSEAIHYAYQNTPTGSPLQKLLADLFAYNVKPDALTEDIRSFPTEFIADVLLINMKRLPLRLENEEADFEMNAIKYHVEPDEKEEAVKRLTAGESSLGDLTATVDTSKNIINTWGGFSK